eukprot:c5892_g1_i2.p1 GENE.c5892_g1_i2~~c5892_g1_i2.p1  ORF type:complete len:227 (-),score=51.11 c5892_g1_i2:26-706(-)
MVHHTQYQSIIDLLRTILIAFAFCLLSVLPYASLNERRDPWRELFHKSFISLVNTTKSISEAVQVLNRDIWTQHGWNITFVPNQTPYSLAVFDVISHGNASCSGLSIFLVSACRSVGIPARVVGTPHWHRNSSECPHGDEDDNCGNHDWVEIWDGKWYFTGAHEYTTAGLDNAWFYPYPAKYQTPQSGNHSIYGTSWLRTSLSFPMVWDVNNSYISAVDVTANYLN